MPKTTEGLVQQFVNKIALSCIKGTTQGYIVYTLTVNGKPKNDIVN